MVCPAARGDPTWRDTVLRELSHGGAKGWGLGEFKWNHVQAVGLERAQTAGEKTHLNTHPSAGAAHFRVLHHEHDGGDLLPKRASDFHVDPSHLHRR